MNLTAGIIGNEILLGDVGDMFKAMETLSEMIHGEEYDIIVSGELKDGKRFKGSAKITITGWESEHRWDRKDPDWLNLG